MRCFFIISTLFFLLTPVYADELRDIRDALGRGEFAGAPEKLLDYLEQFPENTEFVEQIIASITTQLERQRVNINQFVRQVEKNPDDLDALGKAAAAMEKSGGVLGFDLGLSTDELLNVSFTVQEYSELDAIFAEVERAHHDRQFVAAVAFVTDALVIGQDRFLDKSDEQAQTEVAAIVTDVPAISERFRTLYNKQLSPLVRNASAIISGDNASAIEELADKINSVDEAFHALLADAEQVANRIQIFQQNRGERVIYPELLRRVVEKDYYGTLSLANIIEDALGHEIGIILNEQDTEFQRRFERTRTAMNSLEIASASLESSLARALSGSLVRNVQFAVPVGTELTIPVIENQIVLDPKQASVLLHYYSYQSTIELLYQMVAASTVSVLVGNTQPETADSNQVLNNRNAIYESYLVAWRAAEMEISALNQRINSGVVSKIVNETNSAAENFLIASNERSARLYNNYFADLVQQYRLRVDESEAAINIIRPLVYGTDSEYAFVDDIELVKRYPQEAILILDDAIPSINEILDALLSFEPLYRSAQSTSNAGLDNAFENILVRTVNVSNTLRSLQADAEQNIAEAIRLRNDGDRRRSQAENALSRNDGRLANDLWAQAQANYLDSLALREDAQFREQIGQISVAIRDRILEIEHATIVREVRDLINRSRRAISIQDIDEAYSLIAQAADLWAITNAELNPEIVRQQEYVELVLTFEQTYSLVTSNPLYGVISGYLSTAARNIERIDQLVSQGNAVESEPLITETRNIIQNVIDVQPFNTEARTLNLRLIEVANADEVQQILDELFRSASRTATREPRQSLSDFYTIRTLRSGYPGVEQQIAEIETALGLRLVESNTDDQQQASRLLAQAQELIATGDRNRAVAAETLLQEALTFNANNDAVQATLDQLRINNGSSAQANLSVSDEQLLRRAETLFVQGGIAQTFAILENLWRTPLNRNYPPLIALRNQVISRLGI